MWSIQCWEWLENSMLCSRTKSNEGECLKFTTAFDVCCSNLMPTSHFPCCACFWILIATTGIFQLICIMNSFQGICGAANMSFVPEMNFTMMELMASLSFRRDVIMYTCVYGWSVGCSDLLFGGSFQNLRDSLKYPAVIGISLSSFSSINVQFSI